MTPSSSWLSYPNLDTRSLLDRERLTMAASSNFTSIKFDLNIKINVNEYMLKIVLIIFFNQMINPTADQLL